MDLVFKFETPNHLSLTSPDMEVIGDDLLDRNLQKFLTDLDQPPQRQPTLTLILSLLDLRASLSSN